MVQMTLSCLGEGGGESMEFYLFFFLLNYFFPLANPKNLQIIDINDT